MFQELKDKMKAFLFEKGKIDERYEEEQQELLTKRRSFQQQLKKRKKESNERLIQLEAELKANCESLKNLEK